MLQCDLQKKDEKQQHFQKTEKLIGFFQMSAVAN